MIDRWRKAVDSAVTRLNIARTTKDRAEMRLEQARRVGVALTRSREVVAGLAKQIQDTTYSHIAGVVSKCLEAVFDDPYEFRMDFVQRRGRTEVDLVFVREDEVVDPMTASGGGVLDVASFALRLAALALSGPSVRRMLILDEPFKFVSMEYRGRIRDMLEMLSKEFGVQILMVTHIDELKVGKVVELG